MAATYQWFRYDGAGSPPPSHPDFQFSNVNDEFAVYASDLLFGVSIDTGLFAGSGVVTNTWRIQIRREELAFFDLEWRFQRNSAGAETLEARTYNEAGVPADWIDFSEVLGGTATSQLILDSAYGASNLYDYGAEILENVIPGTTEVYFENVVDGDFEGGIGDPDGLLGIGFDIRVLAVKNFQVVEEVTNLYDDQVNTVNFKGEFYALPAETELFPLGWAPISDVYFTLAAGSYRTIVFDEPVPVTAYPGFPGKVGEFDLSDAGSPYPWDGRDSDGYPLEGLHLIAVSIHAENPDPYFNGESFSHPKTGFSYIERCYDCLKTCCPTVSAPNSPGEVAMDPTLYYRSFDFESLPASLGYGWTNEGSMRITETADDVYFKTASGSVVRWSKVSGGYVPFRPGTYIQVETDTTYWKLSFKDSTVFYFYLTDGRLSHKEDRNGNRISYSYDVAGHLSYVSDGKGRSHTYVNRPDGQPEALIENGGRITSFFYDSNDRLESVVDPEGNSTQFSYYAGGPLMATLDPNGYYTVYEYDDPYGRLTRQVGPVSDATRFLENFDSSSEFDPDSGSNTVVENIASLTEATFRQTRTSMDRLGRVTYVSQMSGGSTGYDYNDPLSDPEAPPDPYLLIRVTDHNNNFQETTYDSNGNVTSVLDKAGNLTEYVYADEVEVAAYPKHRNLLKEVHRPPVRVRIDDEELTTYEPTLFEYDSNGNLLSITASVTDDGVVKTVTSSMTYDPDDGLLLTMTNRNGHTTEFHYDGAALSGSSRNLLEVWTPKGDNASTDFRKVYFAYDDYDNVTSVTNDLGNVVTSTYDNLDRLVTTSDARLQGTTSYVYDNTLLSQIVLPPNNGSLDDDGITLLPRITTLSYDEEVIFNGETSPTAVNVSRLVKVERDIDHLRTQQLKVKYAYTGYSQVSKLTRLNQINGEKSYYFDYDPVGRPVASADPLSDEMFTDPGVTRMAYQPFCKGNSVTSARGVRRVSTLDARCLLTEVSAGDPDPEDNLEIINARETRNWEYDELGRLVKSTQAFAPVVYGKGVFGLDPIGSVPPEERTYEYDELDRLRVMTFPDGTQMLWEYDDVGNITKMTDNAGKVTEYTYYRDNLLKEVIIKRDSEPDRVFTYTYDLAGRMLAILYPADSGLELKFDDGSDTEGSGWDADGRLLHMRYLKDGDLYRRLEYTYDKTGNRASQIDEVTLPVAQVTKWEYVYDWLDRLHIVRMATEEDLMSLPEPLPTISTYTYDASDNRITWERGTTRYRYEYDDADNLIKIYTQEGSDPEALVETVESDVDGNMTRRLEVAGKDTRYTWNDFDRLLRVSSSGGSPNVLENNRYDISGIRKAKQDRNGNTSREYTAGIATSSSKPATSSSSSPTFSYITGHQLLGYDEGGSFRYFLTDALGTVRDVVDENGDVIRSMEFNEHGLPLSSSGSGTFAPKTYQGALSVNDDRNDSGLYLMGHRHYAADLGRFISRDPIGFAGGLNLFGTAFGNNPVTFVDPKGLDPTADVLKAFGPLGMPAPVPLPTGPTKILTGTGYGWGCDYHAVPEPNPSFIPFAELVSRGSSKDFVAALETSRVFIFLGHHFGGGDILLSDGHFWIKDLLKQAKRLPYLVIFDACNTGSALPGRGEYPNTVFVGLNDFVDLVPARDWATHLQDVVQDFDPLSKLRADSSDYVPPITVVGSQPYRGI